MSFGAVLNFLNFLYFKFVFLQTLFRIAEKVKNFACMYLVDISKVTDFNKMYELYDPCTVMFFFRNKHIMIDLGLFIIIFNNYSCFQVRETITKSIGHWTTHKN